MEFSNKSSESAPTRPEPQEDAERSRVGPIRHHDAQVGGVATEQRCFGAFGALHGLSRHPIVSRSPFHFFNQRITSNGTLIPSSALTVNDHVEIPDVGLEEVLPGAPLEGTSTPLPSTPLVPEHTQPRNYFFFGPSTYNSYPPNVVVEKINHRERTLPINPESERLVTSRSILDNEDRARPIETLSSSSTLSDLAVIPHESSDVPMQALQDSSMSVSPQSPFSEPRENSEEPSCSKATEKRAPTTKMDKTRNEGYNTNRVRISLLSSSFFTENRVTEAGRMEFRKVAEEGRGELLRQMIIEVFEHINSRPEREDRLCDKLVQFLGWLEQEQNGKAIKFDKSKEEECSILAMSVWFSNIRIFKAMLYLPGIKLADSVGVLNVAYERDETEMFEYLLQKGVSSHLYCHFERGENKKKSEMIEKAKAHHRNVKKVVMRRLAEEQWSENTKSCALTLNMLVDETEEIEFKAEGIQQDKIIYLVVFPMAYSKNRKIYHIVPAAVELKDDSHINGQGLTAIPGVLRQGGGVFEIPPLEESNAIRLNAIVNAEPRGLFLAIHFVTF